MKIAIALCGKYSDIYMKNKYKGDIFAFTYDRIKNDENFIKHEYLDNEILNLNSIQLYNKITYLKEKLVEYSHNCIKKFEEENNIKYDIIVFATFKDLILNFPSEQGMYYSFFYSTLNRPLLITVEVMSDVYIKICGGNLTSIYEAEYTFAQKILDILFDGKVRFPLFINDDNEYDIVVCIPSVIKTSEKIFNYVNYRSIFTHEERFKQTLEQVKTLKELYPQIHIILMEGSGLYFNELKELSKYCTIILNCKDTEGNDYANNNLNKSIYEVYCMKNIMKQIKFNWIFKFGGRYNLHFNFNINNFLKDKPVFKVINAEYTFTGVESIIECIIYSLPKSYKEKYINIFETIFMDIINDSSLAIENLLCKYSDDIYRIDYLDIFGRDAIEGNYNLV